MAFSVAGKFFEHFIMVFRFPLQIYTNQGQNFDVRYFQALCDLVQMDRLKGIIDQFYNLCDFF